MIVKKKFRKLPYIMLTCNTDQYFCWLVEKLGKNGIKFDDDIVGKVQKLKSLYKKSTQVCYKLIIYILT